MIRELPDGYELDDDRRRIDIGVVHRFLSEQSYWAVGRTHAAVVASIEGSQRVVGAYYVGELVGFARVVSDKATFAVLADVFVLAEHRGRGLGVELVSEAVDRGPYRDLGWWLTTDDAQGLYEKLGFREPSGTTAMQRPRRTQAGTGG
jgi:ribosomal protein S18 acetylase RimI-like enzyme